MSVPHCRTLRISHNNTQRIPYTTEVAGFPRNRGDIEEYRSRRVRMDGVVLVDFEEEALRRFLNSEVSSGALRINDIETELERYKQDIISVAEYYDEKELLTVVMGDQDTDEMIEDMVIAVDKIIETRKDLGEDDSVLESKNHDCGNESPCKNLIPSPNGTERPSTVEIREATEEDIRSIEAESRNSKRSKDDNSDEEKVSQNGTKEEVSQGESVVSAEQKEDSQTKEQSSEDIPAKEANSDADKVSQNGAANGDLEQNSETESEIVKETSTRELTQANEKTEIDSKSATEDGHPKMPILFAFENLKTDFDALKDLIVEEIGMCYINFCELVRNDGSENDRLGTEESLNLLQSVLKQDSVSYSNGFFISDFPFDLLTENKFDGILKLGEVSFVCKVKEKSFEVEVDEKKQPEEVLFESPMSERVRIIFVTESNVLNELRASLQEVVSNKEARAENSIEKPIEAENNSENVEAGQDNDLEKAGESIDAKEKVESEEKVDSDINPAVDNETDKQNDVPVTNGDSDNIKNDEIPATNIEMEIVNQDSVSEDKTSRDENEDSTCQDVDDLITDDTLNERTKPDDDSLHTEEDKNASLKEGVTEDSLSQMSEDGEIPIEMQKEKAVLARQQNLDIETTSASESSTQVINDENRDTANEDKDGTAEIKSTLKRQGTYLSLQEEPQPEGGEVISDTSKEVDAKSEQQGDSEKDLNPDKEDTTSQNLPSAEENIEVTGEKGENESIHTSIHDDEPVQNLDKTDKNESTTKQVDVDNADEKIESPDFEKEQDEAKIEETSENENQNGSENQIEETKSDVVEESEKNASDVGEEKDTEDENDVNKVHSDVDDNEASIITNEENTTNNGEGDKQDSESKSEENIVDGSDKEASETKDEENSIANEVNDKQGETNSEKDDTGDKQNEENSVTDVVSEKQEEENSSTGEVTDGQDQENSTTAEVSGEKKEENPATDDVNGKQDEENPATDDVSDKQVEENPATDDASDKQIEENPTTDDVSDKQVEENPTTDDASDKQVEENPTTEDVSDKQVEENPNTEDVNDKQDEENDVNGEEDNKEASEHTQEKKDDVSDHENDGEVPPEKESESKDASEHDTDKEETPQNSEVNENSEANNEINVTSNDNEVKSHEETSNLDTKTEEDTSIENAGVTEGESVEKTDNEELTDTTNQDSTETVKDSGTVILKSMDDSDSNDENADKSTIIETQAEVHAADSSSPPLVQTTEDVKTENSTVDDEVDIADFVNKENNNNNEKNNKEDAMTLQHKEPSLENTDESQDTTENELITIQNQRYSGKHQERNGSGILDESRQADQPEVEEQERSSSSSRGEL
ncbi:uncharacterized protein CDAR_502651 [Caerostris darwini]|uniref:Uncharacterized protein n=1 Tax=Caerostris darwini TaxID=1538125 RepID=A0AAV4RG68_9ARAC|nr:uncharacterized protein CDAR_502651 [Caerostris darwini]